MHLGFLLDKIKSAIIKAARTQMVEDDPEQITPEQELVLWREEKLKARKARDQELFTQAPDDKTYFLPPSPLSENHKLILTAKRIKELVERAALSYRLDAIEAGFDLGYEQDLKKLLENKLETTPSAPVFDPNICPDHLTPMLNRSKQHWICPVDKKVFWKKPL